MYPDDALGEITADDLSADSGLPPRAAFRDAFSSRTIPYRELLVSVRSRSIWTPENWASEDRG